MNRLDYKPPLLLTPRPHRSWSIPPPGLLWFLAGSVTTLLVLAALGVVP